MYWIDYIGDGIIFYSIFIMGILNGYLFCVLMLVFFEFVLGFFCYFIINIVINVDFLCEKEIILKLLFKGI